MTLVISHNNYAKQPSIDNATESRLERGKRLLATIDGDAGQAVINSLQQISPDFSNYLFEYPFGDVYARPGLDLLSKECSATQLAIAWVLTSPYWIIPITGCRKLAHLIDNLAAVTIKLSDEKYQQMNNYFPIGGIAGELYASSFRPETMK